MTDLAIQGLNAEEIAEGKKTKHLRVTGGDTPWPREPTEATGGGFFFRQPLPAASWVIKHPLERYPDVTVQNTAGTEQLALVEYVSLGELIIKFSEPTEGFALLTVEGQ